MKSVLMNQFKFPAWAALAVICMLLADVREELQCLSDTRDKSGFEQEGLGRPDLDGWPFYRSAADA